MSYKKYKKYKTVGDWWEKEGSGKFPIQVPMAISKLQKKQNLTFHEAFERLVEAKAIIFVDEEDKNKGV